ncbi:MAG: hypothetical protein DRN12_02240 [Thermoplasmata archaeon]|nr:MAG: hypothetical protein DRN12_02240 [Thermoplasmata archaeon]
MFEEVAIPILLSIFVTFIAFILAQLMMSILHIAHPKNKFWIQFFVILTAFTVFPFALLETTSSQPSSYHVSQEEIISSNNSEKVVVSQYYTFMLPHNASALHNFVRTILYSDESLRSIINNILYSHSSDSSDTPGNVVIIREVPSSSIPIVYTEKTSNFSLVILSFLSMIALVIFLLLFLLIFGKRHLLRNIKATPCRDKELKDMIKTIANNMGIKIPKVFSFEGPPNAFVFGFPPAIAISKTLIAHLSKKELQTVIKHELAHIKNNDILLKPLLQVLRIVFFYNPFIHLLYSRIINTRELLADASIPTKKEKIIFMEGLIKINEYIKKHPAGILNSITFPTLLSYTSKAPTLSDRFTSLFEGSRKKTISSILICSIILLSNIFVFTSAQSIIENINHPSTKISSTVYCIEFNSYTNTSKDHYLEKQPDENNKMYKGVVEEYNPKDL